MTRPCNKAAAGAPLSSTTNWTIAIESYIQKAKGFAATNHAMVEAVVSGYGPDKKTADAGAGARTVMNISSAHVPSFCTAARNMDPSPYKNGYDLGHYRIGAKPGDLKTRELVDDALPLDAKETKDQVYFGAVELNGSGIRFYGDICLVLKCDATDSATAVLDRNSYDLVRSPLREEIDEAGGPPGAARKNKAAELFGRWEDHLGAMSALKVLKRLGDRERRYTTGQISEALREDEDYMEVLRIGSFGPDSLQEARVSATESAHDALVGDRLTTRPTPRMESLMWRFRRHTAESALRAEDVTLNVVTTAGRTKD